MAIDFMGKIFNEKKLNFKLVKENIKRLLKEELLDLSLSIILSTIMEIFKLFFAWTRSDQANGENVSLVDLHSFINSMETFEVILNIILLTLIIWCITCIAKIFESGKAGRKNKLHTSFVLISFVLAFAWYVSEGVFKIDSIKIAVYFVLYALLLISMMTYFSQSVGNNYKKSKYECDNRIA